jgi:hypothetical protein
MRRELTSILGGWLILGLVGWSSPFGYRVESFGEGVVDF